MQLNSEFDQVVVIRTQEMPWLASNSAGISVRHLEHVEIENQRTTSVYKLDAGASLALHSQAAGAEIIVLEGACSDESDVYSEGTYTKFSPGISKNMFSEQGCLLFIKQGHLQKDDCENVVVDVKNNSWRQGMVGGLSVMPLSEFKGEHTALVRWQPGTVFNAHRHWGGEEIYVLKGVFEDEYGRYPKGTWLRNPHMSQHAPFSQEGCTIFVKVGHLPENDNSK
jgi:anti-sigma factor ChrR (cupin superfamily)